MTRLFIVGTILLFLSSCEIVGPEPCPSQLERGEVSYFPSEVGTEWTYDYFLRSRPFSSISITSTTTGVVEWTIIDQQGGCESTELTVRERIQGERVFVDTLPTPADTVISAVMVDTTLTIRLLGDRLSIEGYTDTSYRALSPIPWIWPASEPEVIEGGEHFWCAFGGCVGGNYRLERDVGLSYLEFSNTSRQGGYYLRTLELVDFQPAL